MGLSCTVSDIDGDFSRKSPIYPIRVGLYCAHAHAYEIPLGIGYRRRTAGVRKKTGMMALPDGPKSFKISLAV